MSNVQEQFDEQLAKRKAAAREIEQKAAEASVLRSAQEDLKLDVERAERRIRSLREIGKGHIERKQEEYISAFGMIEYQPLKSAKTGNELADKQQVRLDGLRAALEANEQQIKQLLAE
ncbi:MAG: hypothetical protein H0W16_04075 [Actinobacteria bacterium]|nr:hypothetical protein [Actinomycetota bacterium]